MFDKSQPLWLPPGSIRALMALSLTGALIFLLVTGHEIPNWIAPVITALVGFYFAGRENNAERVHLETLHK